MKSSLCLILLFIINGIVFPAAQTKDKPSLSGDSRKTGYPVFLNGDSLFSVYSSLGPFSAEVRAAEVNKKLGIFIENLSDQPDSVYLEDKGTYISIYLNNALLMTVTDEDAAYGDTSHLALAIRYAGILKDKLKKHREIYSSETILKNSLYTGAVLIAALLLILLISRSSKYVSGLIEKSEKTFIKSFRVKSREIITPGAISTFILLMVKTIQFLLIFIVIYNLSVWIFEIWPQTRKLNPKPVLKGILYTLIATVFSALLYKGIKALGEFFNKKTPSLRDFIADSVSIKSFHILDVESTTEIIRIVTGVLLIFFKLLLLYFYLTLIFGFFEFSRNWAKTLLSFVIDPLQKVISGFVNYLPNLFYIVILLVFTHYLIKLVRFIFREFQRGNITVPGFYPEWAEPTFKITRFLIIVFAAIVIFPYLPGSDSPFFQGISVFIGILFSLGSTSAISNIVAGVVLTYMRPFKIGDRVKIADTMGDIIEKTLLVTRVRTIKNVDITIPNGMVLGSHIINYSSSAKEKGLVLHTTVTIGYDVPWKKVHELLISAAKETGNILQTPEPFVLQTSLDDFYVSYELNAYTENPAVMARIYSELHSLIQDKFNAAGVEIMSPHYGAMRDGNQTTIPEDYLPPKYEAPAFRIFGINPAGKSDSDNADK